MQKMGFTSWYNLEIEQLFRKQNTYTLYLLIHRQQQLNKDVNI